MALCRYSVLVVAIVASVVVGKPQTIDPSVAPTEADISCECVSQINAEVMPGVNTAINALSTSVDELFKLANATGISPVAVRHACFFCGRIRTYHRRVRVWPTNRYRYHHRPHHQTHHHQTHHQVHHQPHHHQWKRQAANIPACPIDEVAATAQSAREGTQLVNEVIKGVRADPKEVNQDLLDDVTALYNEVNESVKNLQVAMDPNSSDCQGGNASDVAFPGEG